MAAVLTQYFVGATITVDMLTDIQAATVRKIVCLCPGAVVRIFDAELEGTTKLKYVTQSKDDLAIVGKWYVQGYIESPTAEGYGRESCELTIERAVAEIPGGS